MRLIVTEGWYHGPMTDTAERDISPLEEALELHLEQWGRGREDVRIALLAIAYAQAAAKGDEALLDRQIQLPKGQHLTVQEIINVLHLNQFIDWGGGEIYE